MDLLKDDAEWFEHKQADLDRRMSQGDAVKRIFD